MEPNVVSEEYVNLQKGFMEEQKILKRNLEDLLDYSVNKEELNLEAPILPQITTSPVPMPLYRSALELLSKYFVEHNQDINEEFYQLIQNLSTEEVVEWMKGSITFDMGYFTTFSEKYGIDPSLPHFIAEQALRPFMQILGEKCRSFIDDVDVMGICPCCGEPIRLAILQEDGEKIMFCPRCESKWMQKKLECVHCGDDDYENLFYVAVEEDKMSKLEVCKTCRNYIKLAVEVELSGEKQAALLDLETIHLDFVAEEEGYGES